MKNCTIPAGHSVLLNLAAQENQWRRRPTNRKSSCTSVLGPRSFLYNASCPKQTHRRIPGAWKSHPRRTPCRPTLHVRAHPTSSARGYKHQGVPPERASSIIGIFASSHPDTFQGFRVPDNPLLAQDLARFERKREAAGAARGGLPAVRQALGFTWFVDCTSVLESSYDSLCSSMDQLLELRKCHRISSSHVSVAVRGVLFKKIDGASKNNSFQKKVYQKRFICRGDILLSRAKKQDISLKTRKHINEKPMEIELRDFQFALSFH